MEMCRACLATGKDMMPMDENFVSNYNLLTNLNIKLTDDMPLYSCNTCFDAIKFCSEFREKCISSDLTLKEILFPNGEPKCENDDNEIDNVYEIKKEVKLEYDYDSDVPENYYIDEYDEPYMIETTREDEDWPPHKTAKNLKNKLIVKKEPKEKKKQIKVEKLIDCDSDDTLKHCGLCSKTFEQPENLLKHFEHHKLDKSCGLCTERFIDFTQLMAHRIVHLPEKQRQCHLCSQKFVRANYLEFHYIKKHELRGEGGQLYCKICLSPYQTPRKLSKHFWAAHSDIKYTCEGCGKGFRLKQQLKIHINVHNKERRFKCDVCDFTCKFASGVREHKVRKHTEGRVYCKSCGRAFASQERLDKHACKHILGVICPICGVYVTKSSHLPRHIKSHSDAYHYNCERCPAQFKSLGSYKAHINRHDGVKPYQCEYCTLSFYTQSVLIKHRRVHTGERPYVCKICDRGFTGNHNLKVHMKVHGQHLVVKRNSQPTEHIFL